MIPGGGTDGGTFYLAEQLNHTDAEILYMDFSPVSKQIAQTRTRIRKLSNILWITDWLESVPFLGINRFDFVVSSGVLHHLKRPSKGLKVLNDAQLDTGGAMLMVYARYGRTGVYHIQNMTRQVNGGAKDISNEIRNTKPLLKTLPDTNWYLKRNSVLDLNINDIEIYDRLLHKRDVCYDVLDLYEVVESGGYKFVEYDSPESRITMSLNPKIFITKMVPAISKKSFLMKQSIGEIFDGMVILHSIYISKQTQSEAALNKQGNVIFANGCPLGFQNIIHENGKHSSIDNSSYIFARLSRKGSEREYDKTSGFKIITRPEYIGEFVLPSSNFSKFVITKLTRQPMMPALPEKLVRQFKKESKSNCSIVNLKKEMHKLHWYLKLTGMFLLKKKTIPSFPKSEDPSIRFVVYNVDKNYSRHLET